MGGGGEREREGEGDASGLGRRQRGEDGKVWAGWALPLPPLKALFFFLGIKFSRPLGNSSPNLIIP